ncbi:gamma-glutamyl-gamma-aminobutyrate hydrolase family protein [Conexibacter arvalis]|uniref:Gamma-glutamyl-gamma-aminobutyrate hydrolase PuuD n=1 Tax=Conexibacter arvalis TaxID=912552 RepID=A0A840I8F2_9ACTN|nr:gamma-glutamyl-gamma-aminobutyrate hydrolase family protein [Conexibacter arvalis]MBB4660551.1 gamma-glutamyl-gamma-aminobutyrate hydrolase PuuD [Conexibacter arvalis]
MHRPPAPLIGITTYRADARWGVWELPAALTPWAYVEAVADAGGAPVLLPPAGAPAEALVERLDGLLLCGGPDIAPARYGTDADARTGPLDLPRDEHELALIAAARARELPLLGICRGMQLLNVAAGGTLDQHIATAADHAAAPGVFAEHDVALAAGSTVARIVGPKTRVHSYHHQGIASLGADLTATGEAPDGTVEAIEVDGAPFALGVLWHPEMGTDRALFRALVEASRA